MALTELRPGELYKFTIGGYGIFLHGEDIKIQLIATSSDTVNKNLPFPILNINQLISFEGESGELDYIYYANTAAEESGVEYSGYVAGLVGLAICPQTLITEETDGAALLQFCEPWDWSPAIQIGPDPANYNVNDPHCAIMQQSVRVGGFYVDANSLVGGKTWDESGYPVRTWGDDGTVLVCTGTTQSKEIAGSPEESGWCFVAGSRFGVNTKGNLYANEAHLQGVVTAAEGEIGGFNIGATSISKGNSELDAQCIKISSDVGAEESGVAIEPVLINSCWPDTVGPWTKNGDNSYTVTHTAGVPYSKYIIRITNHNYFGNITYHMSCSGGRIYDSDQNCGLDWNTERTEGTIGVLTGLGSYVYVVFEPASAGDSATLTIDEPLYTLRGDGITGHKQNFRRCEQFDLDNIKEEDGAIVHDYFACYTDLSTLVSATNQTNFLYGSSTFIGGTDNSPSVLKLTFNKAVNNFKIILHSETAGDVKNCLIASKAGDSPIIPDDPEDADNVQGSTYTRAGNTEIVYPSITADQIIYIVSYNASGDVQHIYLKPAEYLTSTQTFANSASYYPIGVREKTYDINGIKCYRLPFYNAASNTTPLELNINTNLKALNIYLRTSYLPEDGSNGFDKLSLSPSLLASKLYGSAEPAIWPDHIADEILETSNTACFNQKYKKDVLKENHDDNLPYSIADYKKVTYNNLKVGDKITLSLRYNIKANKTGDAYDAEKVGGYILIEPVIGTNIFTPAPDFYSAKAQIVDQTAVGFSLLDSNDDQPAALKEKIAAYIINNQSNESFFINTLQNYSTFINNGDINGEILHFTKNIGNFTLYLYTNSSQVTVAAGKLNSAIEAGDDPTDIDFISDCAGINNTENTLQAVTYSNIKAGDEIAIVYINSGSGTATGAVLVPNIANDPENCLLQIGQKFGATDAGKLICTNGEFGTSQIDNTGIILGKTNIKDNLNKGTYIGRDGIITDSLRVTEVGGHGGTLDNYKYKIAYAPMLYNDSIGTNDACKVFHKIIPSGNNWSSVYIDAPLGSKNNDYTILVDTRHIKKIDGIDTSIVDGLIVGWTIRTTIPITEDFSYYILYN